MDKVDKYKEIVEEIIDYVGNLFQRDDDPIKVASIKDKESGNYLLFNDGWRNHHTRVYGCFLHLRVTKEGKVWLQYDGTDLEVGNTLMKKGIPPKDIVVGFHSPLMRADTEFALG